jgi:hypothetical protein
MSQSLDDLREWLSGQERDVSWMRSNCVTITKETTEKLTHHQKRIEKHDAILMEHGEDIAGLKAKVR